MILTGEMTLSHAERMERMQQAIDRRLPFMSGLERHQRRVSIACYGPSLRDDYPKDGTIIAVSGAYDFLLERGITPQYYVSMDPRESAVDLLKTPQHGTQYIMASVCHPRWWDHLEGFDVRLWHLLDGNETYEWISAHDPLHLNASVGGGSTVGQRAMNVAAWFWGCRKFDIYGMDCSFAKGHHAGPHNAETQPIIETKVGDRIFYTSPQFRQAAEEMVEIIQNPAIDITFHGDGLMQEIAKNIQKERKL